MSLFQLLQSYQVLFSQNRHIKLTDGDFIISTDDYPYLRISESAIALFGIDMSSRLNNHGRDSRDSFDDYSKFIGNIGNHYLKINHLGFGYRVSDLKAELTVIRNHLTPDFDIVEEKSGDEINNRWFLLNTRETGRFPKSSWFCI